MSGSRRQFVERLFGSYTVDLVKFLTRRVRNRSDARDLAQDAYLRLLSVEKTELIRDPQAYLFRIAANLAYEYQIKHRAGRVPLDEPAVAAELKAISEVTLEEEADLAGRVVLMEHVLRTLPPKLRAAVVLHHQEDMSYEEIAQRIGVSSHAVKKYITVGLTECRVRLARRGVKP